MPIKLNATTYGKKDVFGFDPRDLVKNFAAYTGRVERPDEQIDAMADSLLKDGQLEPFLYRKGFKGEPIPITGHTRILAALRITEKKLPTARDGVEVKYGPKNPFVVYGTLKPNCNELEALLLTFRENDGETRTPPNDLDIAHLIRALGDLHGLKDAEIALKLRKPPSWVSKHRRLLDLDAPTQKQLTQGEMKFDAALAATSVEPSRRQEVIRKAKETVAGGKVTAAAIKSAARDLRVETIGKAAVARTDSEFRKFLALQATQEAFNSDGRLTRCYRGILQWRAGEIDDAQLVGLFRHLEAGPKVDSIEWQGDVRGHGLLVSALRLKRDGCADFVDMLDYVSILNRARSRPPLAMNECRDIANKAWEAPVGAEVQS